MSFSVTECFMAAFAAGLIFGLVYELLRIIRVIFPFKAVTFLCDIAFFLLAAAAVTRLSLAMGNYVRWSLVFGFGAGIFTYINTIGRLFNLVENAVASAVRRVLSSIFGAIGRFASKTFGAIAHTASGCFGKITKIYTDHVKKLHKPLQNRHQMVYNKEYRKGTSMREINPGGSETGHVIKAKVRRSGST